MIKNFLLWLALLFVGTSDAIMAWLIGLNAADYFRILLSLIGIVYFISILQIRIIDYRFGGSWRRYIRYWINKFKGRRR